MPGCFGLLEDPHPSHFPPERLVEAQPCLDVFALGRQGLLMPGASATLLWGDRGCQLATREVGILEVDGAVIRVRTHVVLACPVFACPICDRDCYRLHCVDGSWACRKCHRLDYRSRHRNRSIPGLNRALYLRRLIDAGPLFSPITPRPLSQRKFWRIVAEIRRLESGLVRQTRQDVTASLRKRLERDA